MRIKKPDPPSIKDGSPEKSEEGEKLLQCIMCNCMTIEEYLKRHIRYNHLISKEEIIEKLYNLHYPDRLISTATQTTESSIDTETVAEDAAGNKDNADDDHVASRPPSSSDGGLDDHTYDGDDPDQHQDEEEKCAMCQSKRKVISPVAACSRCMKKFHWACVDLTAKPGRDWVCGDCDVDIKAAMSQDHAYTTRMVNESVQEESPTVKKKVGPKSKLKEIEEREKKKNKVLSNSQAETENDQLDSDRGSVSDNCEEEAITRKITPIKLNNLSDLSDMSKGELRELCFTESVNPKGTREDLEERLRRYYQGKRPEKEKKSKKGPKLSEVVDGKDVCRICGLGWDLPDKLELGPLYKFNACVAHLHCLMFSSGLIQSGEETDGIIGFLPDDIQAELQRGAKLRCAFCKEIYATVGCCQKSCSKSYHLPCGIKYGALSEYFGNFDSYCPSHRAKRVSKARPRNYVLTDMGLIPEQVDADTEFDIEKYRVKLRKFEKELGKREKKSPQRKARDLDQGKTSKEKKHKETSRGDSTDDEMPISRKKKVQVKKEPDENDTGRKSGRRIIKKNPGADIYSSAVDELKKLLAKKQEIKLDETYSDLAGKRRKLTIKKERDESDDDVNWVKPRASTSKGYSRRRNEENGRESEEDVEERRTSNKFSTKKRVVKRKKHENEEESVESIKIFLQTSTKRNKIREKRKSMTDSDEELPYPKIKRKTSIRRIATPPLRKRHIRDSSPESESRSGEKTPMDKEASVNADMESMMDDNESEAVSVDINELINNLSDEEEVPRRPGPKSKTKFSLQGSNKKRAPKQIESESDFEEENSPQLPDSSDFEITERESSQESEEEEIPMSKKSKKEVSFSETIEEFPDTRRKSKSFNMDEILKKKGPEKKTTPAKKSLKKKKEVNVVVEPDIFFNHSDNSDCDGEENQKSKSVGGYGQDSASVGSLSRDYEKNSSKDQIRTTIYFQNSSDEDEPPPPQSETTDADFDKLFSDEEPAVQKGEMKKKEENDSSMQSDINTSKDINSTDVDSDILNKALEETGIFHQPFIDESNKEELHKGNTDGTFSNIAPTIESDTFSASPFKLLFSTFGGSGGNNGASENVNSSTTETENLSTTLDPDEFLQKHFK